MYIKRVIGENATVTELFESSTRISLTAQFQGPCHCGLFALDLLIGQCARDILPAALVEGHGENARAALLTLTEPAPDSEEGRNGVDVQRGAQ